MSNALRYIYDDRFAETMGYEDFEADKEELAEELGAALRERRVVGQRGGDW